MRGARSFVTLTAAFGLVSIALVPAVASSALTAGHERAGTAKAVFRATRAGRVPPPPSATHLRLSGFRTIPGPSTCTVDRERARRGAA